MNWDPKRSKSKAATGSSLDAFLPATNHPKPILKSLSAGSRHAIMNIRKIRHVEYDQQHLDYQTESSTLLLMTSFFASEMELDSSVGTLH
jgi:hypothetical protein